MQTFSISLKLFKKSWQHLHGSVFDVLQAPLQVLYQETRSVSELSPMSKGRQISWLRDWQHDWPFGASSSVNFAFVTSSRGARVFFLWWRSKGQQFPDSHQALSPLSQDTGTISLFQRRTRGHPGTSGPAADEYALAYITHTHALVP